MKNRYSFIAKFHYSDNGISISFQDLPGCLSHASTTEDALQNAKETLGLHILNMERNGEEIPEPSQLQDIHIGDGDLPVLIEVFMPTIRDKANNQFTKKTLSLPAWLAAEGDANNVNFSKIFQNALMEYLEIKR